MSDKLTLKGDVQIREPEVDDWFKFETNVYTAIKENPGRSINAVAEFKSYGGSELLESHKITGKLLSDFKVFSEKVRSEQNMFNNWVLSCTVTLRAVKKGKVAQKALDTGQLALFSSLQTDPFVEAYRNLKEYRENNDPDKEVINENLLPGLLYDENSESDVEEYAETHDVSIDEAKRIVHIGK